MMTRPRRFMVVFVSVTGVALACSRESDLAAPDARLTVGAEALSAAQFSEWSAPVNLGPAVNSPFVDNLPILSKDGQSLYFTSNRPGGVGALDLWVSRRVAVDESWGPPVNLGAMVNSEANDAAPELSRDGHYLYLTSNRPGTVGSNDIWVAWRADIHDDLAWEAPVNLGPPISGPAFDAGAALRRAEFYFTRGPASTALDIYVSDMLGNSFDEPRLVAELSSAANEQRPTIRYDARELFLSSNRPGGFGEDDLWVATRPGAAGFWTSPRNLGAAINTPFVESQPGLSEDGTMLFFTSNRPGGSGGLDLYVSTRSMRARE